MAERFGLVSWDLWPLRVALSEALSAEPVRLVSPFAACDTVVGWADGRGAAARLIASMRGLPFRAVRVGPLGYVRPGPDEMPASLVLDGFRAGAAPGSEAVRDGLKRLRRLRLAWRNDGRDRLPSDIEGPLVLLVADVASELTGSVQAALRAYPGSRVVAIGDSAVRTLAPGRRAGPKIVSGVNPWALFDVATAIQAPDGRLTDLARIAGVRVVGDPAAPDPAAVFGRCFLEEPIYLDAWSGCRTSFDVAADQLAWLRDRLLDNDRPSVCVGVSRWKAARVSRFLDGPDGDAIMVGDPDRAVARAHVIGGRIVAWETRMPARLEAACEAAGVPLLRMEDGFLRSVGLGAAFLPGASCVLDGRGIYYDPRRESDLEHVLATAAFDDALLDRARNLRREIVALRLSKYNVGRAGSLDGLPGDRPVVLVPGQVEDDASVLLGSPRVPGNLALLRAARRDNPDAYVLFKPHPDVQAGLRRGRLDEAHTRGLADAVIGTVSIVDLIDRADAVETMTSLAGFEALMRGKRTVVHGRPFYAGWGLTIDRDPIARRTRRLTLDELVAGALILYPRYLDPSTGRRCPPEVLVRRLAEARDAARHRPASVEAARAAYARARHALLGPIGLMLRRRWGAVRGRAEGIEPPR